MCAMFSKIDPSLTGDALQYSVENQYFERKSARIQDKEIAHQISAMANASGGVIAVGIEDNGDITGVTDERENKLRQVPIDFLRTIPNYQVEILLAENGEKVFLFHVAPMPDEVIKEMCIRDSNKPQTEKNGPPKVLCLRRPAAFSACRFSLPQPLFFRGDLRLHLLNEFS